MEGQLKNKSSSGRVICVFTSIAYLFLFLICAPPPSGPAGGFGRAIGIVYASIFALFCSIVASSFLYAKSCRKTLHCVPIALLLAWSLFFAPQFIPKPYYWGGVIFKNRSEVDIWVENEGLVKGGNKEGFTGGSGVNWGNSPDSITVVWWVGGSSIRPLDEAQINRMVLRPPSGLARRTALAVTIDENGE